MNSQDKNLKKTAATYWQVSLWILCALSLVSVLVLRQMNLMEGVTAVVVAVMFNLLVAVVYGQCWLKTVQKIPMILPKFYLVASALRLFAAAATMLIYCVILRSDAQQLKIAAIIFLVFYIVMLVFETVYFVRKSKTLNLFPPIKEENNNALSH